MDTSAEAMDIAVDVDALLAESKSKHKSTEVKKDVELQFDLGNLLATDLNIIDTAAFRCVCVCVCVCMCVYVYVVCGEYMCVCMCALWIVYKN